MNGGMQRCFHILHQLALHFKVTAIINQDKEGFEKSLVAFPALSSVNIYSTKNEKEHSDLFSFFPYRIKNALRYRWYKRSFADTTDSNFLLYYPVLKKVLKKKKFDLVILENLDTINAVDIIRRYDKNVPVFYDAHNVDSQLAEEKAAKGILPLAFMHSIKKTESNLYKTVDGILTCSTKDLIEFKEINQGQLNGQVVPNGVFLEDDLFADEVQSENPKYIMFCGSLNYEPNTDGLNWFYDQIWPIVQTQFPTLQLLVVGSGNLPDHLIHLTRDSSLYFTGRVEDVKPYYNKAAVAIVPLQSGSGTRLKILEAMNFGVPVVSTSKGAEGIVCKHEVDILIANEKNHFALAIIDLCNNKDKRLFIQKNGRELMKRNYDWNIIGMMMYDFINEASNNFTRHQPR